MVFSTSLDSGGGEEVDAADMALGGGDGSRRGGRGRGRKGEGGERRKGESRFDLA